MVDYVVMQNGVMKNVKRFKGNPGRGMFFTTWVAHHGSYLGKQVVYQRSSKNKKILKRVTVQIKRKEKLLNGDEWSKDLKMVRLKDHVRKFP